MTEDPDFGLHRDFYTFPPELLGEAVPEFAIVREIGRGSMGIVYEATRRQDGLRIALKVLPPSPTLSERTLARFLREGRVMARVQHPNITGFLGQGHGQAGGVRLHWFVMEYVEGVSLQERLQVGPLPLQHACELAVQAARALQFAHERGVVHRDVKPGNLILRAHPTGGSAASVAITDFGLARETGTGSMTESGAIVGTPVYMAPELVLGGSAQAGTLGDVYALGATLYAMLTGRPPFDGPTAQSVLKQVVDAAPVRPRRLRADLPADAEAIVLKAMAKDPRQRYGSAFEFADDLERLLRGERTLARLPGPLVRLGRLAARRPLLAGLLLLVLLLAGGALQLLQSQRRHALQQGLAEARNWLAQAATARDEQDQPRTPAQRRELLLAAVAAANDCIATDGSSVDPHLLRARALHELRQFADALLDLDAAERLLGGPSREILQRRIETLRECGDPPSIRRLQQDLTRLLALDPGDRTRTLVAEHLLELADQAAGMERSEALLTAREVLDPVAADDARAAVLRARILESSGKPDDAVAAMQAARLHHEGDVYVHLQAAAMFERLGLQADSQREQATARLLQPEGAENAPAPIDLQGLGSFLGDVNRLLQSLEPPRPGTPAARKD